MCDVIYIFFPRRKDPTPTPRSRPWKTSHGRRLAEGSEWRCRLAWLSSCWTLAIPRSSMGLIYLPCSDIIYHYLQKSINHSGKYTSVLWIRPGMFVDTPPQAFLPDAFQKWLVIGHPSIILWQSGCLGLRVLITAFGGFWRMFKFASFTVEHFVHVPSEPSNLSPLSTVRND